MKEKRFRITVVAIHRGKQCEEQRSNGMNWLESELEESEVEARTSRRGAEVGSGWSVLKFS